MDLFDPALTIPLLPSSPEDDETNGRLSGPENWYTEPFSKKTGCKTPGMCGDDCTCDCPYNTMTELERLPLIEEIARIFPNQWLAFIISPDEDDELEPIHGKLVAHSPTPDEVYDAVNTVLWNQHVYIFFNGDFETLKNSYGTAWNQPPVPVAQRAYSGPQQINEVMPDSKPTPLPDNLMDLVYSAVDQLYGLPNLNESIRRLRRARVRATRTRHKELLPILDSALDQLETSLPRVNEVAWFLEEALTEIDAG